MDEIARDKTAFYDYVWTYPWSPVKLEFCRQIKNTYGWKSFNFQTGKWRFNDFRLAIEIKKAFPEVKIAPDLMLDYSLICREVERENAQLTRVADIKNNLECDLEIEGINQEENKMYPYQKKTVEVLVNNGGKLILADGLGVGKTLQSLAYSTHSHKNKTLIVCPASVKYNWENEITKWVIDGYAFVVDPKTESSDLRNTKAPYIVINYDVLGKFLQTLLGMPFDLLIADEVHYAKSTKSLRSKNLRFLARKIPSMVLMSGTPMLSRPVELFNILNMIDPVTWKDYYDFTVKFCNGHRDRFGWNAKGASNMEELQEKIDKYFLRRTKEEILPQLPPKTFIDYSVELPPTIREKYELAYEEFATYLRNFKQKEGTEIERIMQAEALVKLGALRQLTTEGKIAVAKELIEEIIDSGEKVVVFSCYNAPLEYLNREFGGSSVLLTGKVDAEDRQDLIDRFQKEEDCKIFLGGTKSAGIGITLTASSTVIFIDYSWTPADHEQSMDRIHRLGQTASHVNIYQLYARNSIDEYMRNLLAHKKEIVDKIIDGKDIGEEEGESVQKSLIKEIYNRV